MLLCVQVIKSTTACFTLFKHRL